MNSTFYIQRCLSINEKTYTEAELLAASNYVVILAEPGAGKTELMGSLARQLGATVVTANKFAYTEETAKNIPLVIDAFDELSKVDASGISKLLGKATATKPTHIYLSSRSSEWEKAATVAFKEFTGVEPLVVRLCVFDETEQRKIFDHHFPKEDFATFQAEVTRFDLEMLLPNPEFLKLFAYAYVESGRHFDDKRSIFAKAVEGLAKEVNLGVATTRPPLSTSEKVYISANVFTKLLLSGAEGVCTSEAAKNQMYPLLTSVVSGDIVAGCILATRLFKPGDSEGQHRYVHKIVAEYCAADYLTKRIADVSDSLTVAKCLSIIAPNSTVRDELRGLLGWMAALGIKSIAQAAIKLDPYAVLANGDPSQLEPSSKRLLLRQLKDAEVTDPYFRRGDFWRRFSVAGFFTPDVVEDIKPLLMGGSEGDLRGLLLELLVGSPAIEQLKDELRQLTLEPTESEKTRLLANRCLRDISDDEQRAGLDVLISEASNVSLGIAAETIKNVGLDSFERSYLEEFLRVCSSLYPDRSDRNNREMENRYFLREFVAELDLATTEKLLDGLTKDLVCECGKKSYECECRTGISKMAGLLLDRYFELATPPFNPLQIWQWINPLNFYGRKSADQSKAVNVLHKDDNLRRAIIAHVFDGLTDRGEILDTLHDTFSGYSHSGLNFQAGDNSFIVDLAFEIDNPNLWAVYLARHDYYRDKDERGPNDLRRHMREHALEKPLFMREWTRANKDAVNQFTENNSTGRVRHSRSLKCIRRKQNESHASNIKYVKENREPVEAGRHWSCLKRFAELTLQSPEKIETEFGDEILVRNALRNSIDFIAPLVPDLPKLAELQCASQYQTSEQILYAACLEIMRDKGNLEEVDLSLLRALRTNIHMSYRAVSSEELKALENEVNRLIFPDQVTAEEFLRQYVEPQLAHPRCANPDIWLLKSEKAFGHLRAKLSVEWLKNFRELAFTPLNTLFEMAVQHGNRDALKEIIEERCREMMFNWPNPTDNEEIEKERTFWFVRAWYFLNDIPELYWNWLKADKDTVLLFYSRSGRTNSVEYLYWPKFTAMKVEAILDAFIDKWPKVDLPNHWGSMSPKGEKAYRFLTDIVWLLSSDAPDDAIPVLNRLLDDPRCTDLHNNLKSIHAGQMRKKALMDFEPPTPLEIVNGLDHDAVVSVEDLRQLVIQELQDFQKDIDGGEFNPADQFYEKEERLSEVRSTKIIAERLSLKLLPQGISVTLEHQLKDEKRSDFTATKVIDGKRRLLVVEVKGQWHKDLYTAASAQLYDRYASHPDAEQQGVFLALWFGENEKVANRKNHGIENAEMLKQSIEAKLPQELAGRIDVFVLDVSRNKST